MLNLTDEVQSQFQHLLESSDWLSNSTKHTARCCTSLSILHRWASLLTQQTSFTIYRLLTKENKLPFSICRKQWDDCRFHFTFPSNKRKLPFPISFVFCLYLYIETAAYRFIYVSIIIYICYRFKWKTEVQGIFLTLFTICSSCKWKFVFCRFVYEETNRGYPFAN
jgi:hypothetical protein